MNYQSFLDPEEKVIDGTKFTVSRIPAIQAQKVYGDIMRSITDIGDIGMTFLPEPVSRELLSYTAFCDDGTWFEIDQDQRMDRAFKDLQTLIKLEVAMISKNFGFLFGGLLQDLLAELHGKNEKQGI